jgi:hypothetical protein
MGKTHMYNLTELQKETIRWIVKEVRAGNLQEEFSVIRAYTGDSILGFNETEKNNNLPSLSDGTLYALKVSGLIYFKVTTDINVVHCTLLGDAYKAVDSNFGDLIVSLKKTAFSIFNPVSGNYQYDLFVIMPFKQELKPIYADHIKKAAERLNLTIARGDDFFTNHSIMQDVWSAIYQAKIIIADCTDKNPNVFYEIGLAHAIGKPVILITQNENDVPFDLRHIRYILYAYTPPGMMKFENALSITISTIFEDIRLFGK